MNSDQVVDLSRRGVISFDEACERVRVLRSLTSRYVEQVESRMSRLEILTPNQMELIFKLEEEVNLLIYEWHNKVRKLAGTPRGLWLVDFDAGFGYYCWKYPEDSLQYWHSYGEGFEGRKKIILENEAVFTPQNIVSTKK